MTDLHTIERASSTSRVIACLTAVVALIGAWYAISWQLGNMLAVLTQPSDLDSAAIADTALWLAPSDPLAYALKASVNPDSATTDARQAVLLAPEDFRYRIQFG